MVKVHRWSGSICKVEYLAEGLDTMTWTKFPSKPAKGHGRLQSTSSHCVSHSERTLEVPRFGVFDLRDGDCIYGPKFVHFGEDLEVVHEQFRYTITARYVVRILLAHDLVRFDMYRELTGNFSPARRMSVLEKQS